MFGMLTMSTQQYPPSSKPAANNQQESSSEDFEELAESRELVEEKLFKTKIAVINLTLTQT